MDKLHILDKHLEFKKTSVKSEEKIKDIKRCLTKFLESTNEPLSKINEDDIAKFLNSLNYSIRTINDFKATLKCFIKWYYPNWSSKFRNLDKLFKTQSPPKAYQPEQMISLEEIKKIVEGEEDLMWKVYWMVFFYGGFRPSEACRLKWENIFFEPKGTIIKIHTTKTNKDFYKSVPREVEHLLKEWKQYNHSEFLFPSPIKKGNCIKARSVCCRLKRLSKRTLGKEVVPYALRHSIATILYCDKKRESDDTANQMGHSKNMKQTYMNLNVEQIKSKARSLWIKTKPLSKDERDKLEELETKIERFEKFEELVRESQLDFVNALLKNNKDKGEEKTLEELRLRIQKT